MKIARKFKHLCIWISVILAVSLALPAKADNTGGTSETSGAQSETAAEMRLIIADHGTGQGEDNTGSAVTVSGLKITADPGQQTRPGQQTESGKQTGPGETATEAGKPSKTAGNSEGIIEELSKLYKENGELLEEVTVISKEKISWQIPVFWVTADYKTVRRGTPGEDCLPVLAFFVPDEYVIGDKTDAGSPITLDAYLSSLYEEAGGAVCIYDPNTGITYILPGDMDAGVLGAVGDKGKEPAKTVPGLPEELRKPSDGTYDNPASSGSETKEADDPEDEKTSEEPAETPSEEKTNEESSDKEDPAEEEPEEDPAEEGSTEESTEEDSTEEETEDPLTREQLLGHCSNTALNKYDEDELAAFVNLIITSIQPQAVNLIRTRFPAFAAAAENDGLGEQLGLYVYRMYGDKDGVEAHEEASPGLMAYVAYDIDRDENEEAQLSYVLGINLYFFETTDENGQRHIDTSEQAVADMDNSIVHEMLHAFMYDRNRTGSIGTNDPSDYFGSVSSLRKSMKIYAFPSWFEEGIASSVENVYQFRYEAFQLLRYESEGVIGDRYTAENLLNTYTTTAFVLENGQKYQDVYDLEDPDGGITSTYVTGYLADLYLGELAAQYAGLGSSVTVDDEGSRKVSSETIRLGLNSILQRMHNGESLDEVICSISGGAYQSTEDFEKKFIKGTDNSGDDDSISFVVDYLNYMKEIGETSAKIPNGSILFDFAQDYTTPIDRTVTASESIYQITDSSDYVASTVTLETPYTDGGKSKESVSVLSAAAVSNTAVGADAAEDEESGGDDLLAAKVSDGEALLEAEEEATAAEAETEPANESSDELSDETAELADDAVEAEEPVEEAEQSDAALEEQDGAEQEEQSDAEQEEQDAAAEQAAEVTSAAAEESEPAEETSEPEEQEAAQDAAQEMAETSDTGETAEETAEQE